MKNILIIEDNEDDLFILRRACEGSPIPHSVQCLTDGQAALDYLLGNKEYADRLLHPLPDLIFLDVKMPLVSGFDVLEQLRAEPALKHLPVVMLTGSHEPTDVNRAYVLGATSFVRKTLDAAGFIEGIRTVLQFWLRLSENMPPD